MTAFWLEDDYEGFHMMQHTLPILSVNYMCLNEVMTAFLVCFYKYVNSKDLVLEGS